MKLCDKNAKRVRINTDKKLHKYNIRYVGDYALLHDRLIVSSFINEIIWGISTTEEE